MIITTVRCRVRDYVVYSVYQAKIETEVTAISVNGLEQKVTNFV